MSTMVIPVLIGFCAGAVLRHVLQWLAELDEDAEEYDREEQEADDDRT